MLGVGNVINFHKNNTTSNLSMKLQVLELIKEVKPTDDDYVLLHDNAVFGK